MIVDVRGREVKLPDFFLIGAARSGTTTLYFYLNQHPHIFLPQNKEPLFFSFREQPPHLRDSDIRVDRGREVVWKFEEYEKLFGMAKNDQIIGEASSSYLYTHDLSIKHIKSVYGEKSKDIRMMAVLRNPIERAFSHYLLLVEYGRESLSFEEAIQPRVIESRRGKLKDYDYIEYGMYSKRVKAYLEAFEHVRLYLFEDLKEPTRLLEDVFKFLEVDCDIEIDTNVRANPSGIPKSRFLVNFLLKAPTYGKLIIPMTYRLQLVRLRDAILRKLMVKPTMRPATRQMLIDLFRTDVLELQQLLKRDLSQWLVMEKES